MPMDASLYLLLGRARASVLKVLHAAADQGTPLHLREIARRAGLSPTAVQYELRLLRQLRMLQDIGTDTRPLYVLDSQHPLFSGLHALMKSGEGEGLLQDDVPIAKKRARQRRDRRLKSAENSSFLRQWGTLSDKVRVV